MKREIDLKVNGETYDIVVDTRETLLDALRYRLGFMGPKEGCCNGNFGSCTVSPNGQNFEPVAPLSRHTRAA